MAKLSSINHGMNIFQGFKNKIINGNFDIWQRGTSRTDSGYLADRWHAIRAGSTSFSVTQQPFTIGQTEVPGEPKYFHRVSFTTGGAASYYTLLTQPIEGVRTLAGQTVTVSFWAKADASKNIAVELFQNFGTGGTPSSSVTASVTTVALSTGWQEFTVTATLPSISGKTLGTNDDDKLQLIFWFDAGSDYNSRTNSLGNQSGTFDIAQVQFEKGSVATEFEDRPIGMEEQLCYRYCVKWDNDEFGTVTSESGTDSFYFSIIPPVPMRASPSMTATQIRHTRLGTGDPDLTISVTSYSRYGLQCTITDASSSGEQGYANLVSGQSIELDAEL